MNQRAIYDQYLQSPAWKAKRQQRIDQDQHQCQGCGRTTDLHVHHINYSRFGGRETPADLITVCADCHTGIHQLREANPRNSLT